MNDITLISQARNMMMYGPPPNCTHSLCGPLLTPLAPTNLHPQPPGVRLPPDCTQPPRGPAPAPPGSSDGAAARSSRHGPCSCAPSRTRPWASAPRVRFPASSGRPSLLPQTPFLWRSKIPCHLLCALPSPASLSCFLTEAQDGLGWKRPERPSSLISA